GVGDAEGSRAYIAELTAYYRQHASALPPTERDRLERNALRLLDSKDPAMAGLNAAAPRITDHLCDACAAHFEAVKAHLVAVGVPWRGGPPPGGGPAPPTRAAPARSLRGGGGPRPGRRGGGGGGGAGRALGGDGGPSAGA